MSRVGRSRNLGTAGATAVANNAGVHSASKKRRSKASSSVSNFARSLASTATINASENLGATSESSASNSVAEIVEESSLLAIQEKSALNSQSLKQKNTKAKAIEYAEGLLQRLDALHTRLLAGEVSQERLEQLEAFFAQNHKNTNDKKLQEILAEIELRVQVELAKRKR